MGWKDRVKKAVNKAADQVKKELRDAPERFGNFVDNAADQIERAVDKFEKQIKDEFCDNKKCCNNPKKHQSILIHEYSPEAALSQTPNTDFTGTSSSYLRGSNKNTTISSLFSFFSSTSSNSNLRKESINNKCAGNLSSEPCSEGTHLQDGWDITLAGGNSCCIIIDNSTLGN